MQAELTAAGREQRVTHQQRLLDVARQQGELEEQLSLAHAERDRSAGEIARAALTREQLTAAQEEVRQKEGEIARLAAQVRQMTAQMPAMGEARSQMHARAQELETALQSANGRCAGFAQQLAEMEQVMASDGFRWLPMASDGFRWLPMAPDGFGTFLRWLPMASDGF